MKQIILLLFLFFSIKNVAQTCNGMNLMTQQDVDNFNCTIVNQGLNIGAPFGGDSDITNLENLSSLTTVNGTLVISNMPNLISLKGLENLTSVNDDSEGVSEIRIEANDQLVDLDGLNNLSHSEGTLWIQYNDGLRDLNGLDNLKTVGAGIIIQYNDNLLFLNGIESLEYLGAGANSGVRIFNNPSLISISQFNRIGLFEDALGIAIRDNNNLESITGFQNVDSVEQVAIINNSNLSLCSGVCYILENSPSTSYNIGNNKEGCNSKSNIEENCEIACAKNLFFTTQEEIDNYNPDGENCKNIVGDLIIRGNDIDNIQNLNQIQSIEGSLRIYSNNQLEDLNVFQNLVSIKGDILIESTNFSDLSGLANLCFIGGNVSLINNENLADCEFFCDIKDAIKGTVFLSGNENSCNYYQEIIDDCWPISVSSYSYDAKKLVVSPNPTFEKITIKVPANETIESLKITNGMQFHKSFKINENSNTKTCDLSTIQNPGIYFVIVETNYSSYKHKIVIHKKNKEKKQRHNRLCFFQKKLN
ncbi:T9SS type A sorting domain-containing protein [Aureivirga marina]|uniref:T9SS type A sorting domain-containing protein n=1 Tax=Aureivirga marina TaxID=1182451 RepID=UPI0018CB14C2|nr:T9SS type A sorting domain-containing protein [Aureivirga marina]